MIPSRSNYRKVLNVARELVEDDLLQMEKHISKVVQAARPGVQERIDQLTQRQGKRIRSTLLCLIANMGEASPEKLRVGAAGASVELLHLASLVHDDIIDGTELRRGERTAHVKWGNKIAVLVGDYILSQAMRCVIDEIQRDIPIILSSAADDLISGEIMELDYAGNFEISYDEYIKVITGKTAALVDAAARIGAIIAGFSPDLVDECGKMGVHFGLAFQIIDDLLDYGVGAEDLDKAKFTDISNGLITLPLIHYFKNCSETEHLEMQSLLANAIQENTSQEIISRLEKSLSFEYAKNEALRHLEQAIEIAQKLPSSEYSETLTAFFSSMSARPN